MTRSFSRRQAGLTLVFIWVALLAFTLVVRAIARHEVRSLDANPAAVAQRLANLDRGIGITLLAVALATLPLAWWQSRRAAAQIRRVTDLTREASHRSFKKRIPTDKLDAEFVELVDHFNDLLARFEKSFGQARRFSADAAHELRTPLTVLQGEIEAALNGAVMGSAQQRSFSGLLDEVEHLKMITGKLLTLSLADSSRLPMEFRPVDLPILIRLLVEDTELQGPHLDLVCEVPSSLTIQADSNLLTQAIRNLLSNAVKYNIAADEDDPERIVGCIRVVVDRRPLSVRIRVGNTGQQINPEQADRVFDRFYRVDASHNRRVAGAGLGLSLARETARGHSGELTVAQESEQLTHPTTGDRLTTFVLDLPAES
jgi:signal transduction histidine kinase